MGLGPMIIARNMSKGKYGYVPYRTVHDEAKVSPVVKVGAAVIGASMLGTIIYGNYVAVEEAKQRTPYNLIIVKDGVIYRFDNNIAKGEVKDDFKVIHLPDGMTAYIVFGTEEVDKNAFSDLIEAYIRSEQENAELSNASYDDIKRVRG